MKVSKGKLIKRIVIITLCVLIVLFCLASFFGVMYVYKDMFGRADIPEFTACLRYEDVKDEYSREDVEFESDGNTLQGHIYGDTESARALVVISHGLGGYSESYLSETLYFVDNGYAVFGYDNTGSGESEGEGTTGMAQSRIDLDSALSFVEENEKLSNLPVLLYGHSWGGYAVTSILSSEHDIAASASVAGYNTPMEIILEFGEEMMPVPLAYLEYPFLWLNNKIIFGENSDISAVDSINSCDTPVMLIHGKTDETVEYNGASIISHRDEITNPNVKFKTVEGEYSGHNSLYMTEEAFDYSEELTESHEELAKEYDGEIPHDVEKEFFDSIDKEVVSGISDEFMNDVNEFYMSVLEKYN